MYLFIAYNSDWGKFAFLDTFAYWRAKGGSHYEYDTLSKL